MEAVPTLDRLRPVEEWWGSTYVEKGMEGVKWPIRATTSASLCAQHPEHRSRRRSPMGVAPALSRDRKSTRLNSSHQIISYAVFCLKKKKKKKITTRT